jgi:hypothetical protein
MTDVIVVSPPSVTVSVSPAVTPSTPAPQIAVYEGQPGPQGVPGQQGPAGPVGPPGPTPTIAYTHTQNTVSSTWTITHNLGFYPNVVTLDSAGTIIEGGIAFDNVNQITVSFSIATSGIAYLS